MPDAPDFLPPYAKDEWYRIAEELYYLKLLTRIDMQPLAAYCNAYATWRTAVETLAEIAARDPAMKGLLMKTTKGAMQSPLVMTARQSANDMVRYACEFGLTPAARTRINSADTLRAGKQIRAAPRRLSRRLSAAKRARAAPTPSSSLSRS